MKVLVDTDMIWDKVRHYNELSNTYSHVADSLTELAQELESENE